MRLKREIRLSSRKLFANIAASILVAGCASNEPAPACNYQMWVGRPSAAGVVRTNENRELKCEDPAFKDYICFSKKDFENYNTCGEASE